MTYIKAFEKIKERLSEVTAESFTRAFAIQVNLVNKDCAGAFYVANLDGSFAVEPYDYRDNSAMITLMLGDFIKLVEGKLNIEKAMEAGRLKTEGDFNAVEQLIGIVKAEEKPKNRKFTEKKVLKETPLKKETKKKKK